MIQRVEMTNTEMVFFSIAIALWWAFAMWHVWWTHEQDRKENEYRRKAGLKQLTEDMYPVGL